MFYHVLKYHGAAILEKHEDEFSRKDKFDENYWIAKKLLNY